MGDPNRQNDAVLKAIYYLVKTVKCKKSLYINHYAKYARSLAYYSGADESGIFTTKFV